MRLISLSLVLLAAAAAQEQTAVETIRHFTEATRTGDVTTLERLTDPRYFEISPAGEFDSRTRFLGFYDPAKFNKSFAPKSIDLSEIQSIDLGAQVLLSWKESMSIETPAGPRAINARVSAVLINSPEGWKLLSRHVTSIRSTAPPRP